MCGIAGYVDPDGTLESRGTLARMAAALAHRGPDGEGFYAEGPIGLAHRRLAVIDLTETGEQPLLLDEIVLVFNGEIYNYLELREELRRAGHPFAGTSDTEVLARAYLQWGSQCVTRLRGMWAFALYDRRSSKLLCSRDPFGIKPFYFASHRGAFIFASEPRALLAAGVRARANLPIAAQYLALGVCDHSHECFFSGIQQLAAGHSVWVDKWTRVGKATSLEPFPDAAAGASSPEEFESALDESIRLHLRSDVPVGTCLSGGLDSSTVAALASAQMRLLGNKQFSAVTAASEDARTDERRYAQAVVEHCNLTWHVVQPGAAQFVHEIDACITAQGEPALSPSIYLQYCVMRAARDAGIKVMLDGQGGDELLGGYERYVPTFALEVARDRGTVAAIREFRQLARNSRPGLYGMSVLAGYLLLPGLRTGIVGARVRFMRDDLRTNVRDLVEQLRPASWHLRAARIADITRFSLPALLRYEDRNSMAHSVEARVPYVDGDVVCCALRLPERSLLQKGFSKYPLRIIAARRLPAAIAWRRAKIGFEAPMRQWLAGLEVRIRASVESSTLLRRICRKVPRLDATPIGLQWRLYNLSRWQQIFDVDAD